jgi:hypothetical protein
MQQVRLPKLSMTTGKLKTKNDRGTDNMASLPFNHFNFQKLEAENAELQNLVIRLTAQLQLSEKTEVKSDKVETPKAKSKASK